METGKRVGGKGAERQGGYREPQAGGRESRTRRAVRPGSGDPLWKDQGTGKNNRRIFGQTGFHQRGFPSDEGGRRRRRYRGSRGKVHRYPTVQEVGNRG